MTRTSALGLDREPAVDALGVADPALAGLLDELGAFIARYVVLTHEQLTAVVLWVAHTHAFESADTTPYLHITSAEKRSGKTRLLEVLQPLVREPLVVANISDAALFRAVDEGRTLLLDECDAIFAANRHNQEDKRALLNAGYRRSGRVVRCEGPSHQLREFSVFSAKALAGIGDLPDTIADRSIRIALQRKLAGEEADRFRHREATPIAERLRVRLEQWVSDALPVLRRVQPTVDALDDRAADGWEPLLAIAQLAGLDWDNRSRTAALTLSGPRRETHHSPGLEVLAAIRRIFDRRDVQSLTSAELILELSRDEDGPYQSYWDAKHERPATGVQHQLARLLRPYDIKPTDVRYPDGVRKSYRRHDFSETWRRHLPPQQHALEQNAQARPTQNEPVQLSLAQQPDVSRDAAPPRPQRHHGPTPN
jgi:hypothetical protein